MAQGTVFIPEIPFGPADVWEFDGELSLTVNENVEVRRRAVERTGVKVTDAAFLVPPTLVLTGLQTATPYRLTITNPTGPFVGPTRLQSEYGRIRGIIARLGLGIVNAPDFQVYFDYMITSMGVAKASPERKHDYTMTFEHISLVRLGIVPLDMSSIEQGLGYGGVVDKGSA